MSRLKDCLQRNAGSNEKALGIFLTSGYPEKDATVDLLIAIDRGGADFIEIGMPFSDPLAEGLPIQKSSERALRNGTTMSDTFAAASTFRSQSETPLVLMGYINPIIRSGISNFFALAHSSGIDGLILPDVPLEESDLVASTARQHGIDLIQLIAPTTPDDRVQMIDARSTGFVYAVSVTGLTGTTRAVSTDTRDYLQRVRPLVSDNPLLVGFGISSHSDVVRMSEHTDGCIVGSALIKLLDSLWGDDALTHDERLSSVRGFVSTLKFGSSLPSSPDTP